MNNRDEIEASLRSQLDEARGALELPPRPLHPEAGGRAMKGLCENCYFWAEPTPKTSAGSYGQCRRYPPQLYPKRGDFSTIHNAEFPKTWSGWTCGEHAPTTRERAET